VERNNKMAIEFTDRYLETKVRKAQRAHTRRFQGVPLVAVDKDLKLDAMQFPMPIQWCLCVMAEGCPCTDLVAWLRNRPIEMARTGKRTPDGQEILEFTVSDDADVSVEMHIPLKLRDLQKIEAATRRRRKGDKEPSTAEAPAPAPPPFAWVAWAGAMGYAGGKLLDDLLGSNEGGNDNLSDDISDWLAENLPAPDWAKDIF
jgi:hypothetical protein